MICPKCNSQMPDNVNNCPNCGTPVQATPNMQANVSPVQQTQPAQPVETPKKKSNKTKIIAIVIAAVVAVIAIVVGVLFGTGVIKNASANGSTNNSGNDISASEKEEKEEKEDTPIVKLEKSIKSLFDSDNFTADINISAPEYEENVDIEVIYDNNNLLYFAFEIDGETMYGGIYNKELLIAPADEDAGGKVDLSDIITDDGKISFAPLDELNVDDKNYFLKETISMYADIDDIDGAFDNLYTSLKEQLKDEENAGYTVTESDGNTVIKFDIDVCDLYDFAVESVSPALSDQVDELIKSEEEYLKEELELIDATLTFTLEGKTLSDVELIIEYEDTVIYEIEIEIYDINNTDTEDAENKLDTLQDNCIDIYDVVLNNAATKTCISNHREIISQLNNCVLTDYITFSQETVFKIITDSNGDVAYEFVSGDYTAFKSVPQCFQQTPCCPTTDSEITVTVSPDEYYGITINVECTTHGNMNY